MHKYNSMKTMINETKREIKLEGKQVTLTTATKQALAKLENLGWTVKIVVK